MTGRLYGGYMSGSVVTCKI